MIPTCCKPQNESKISAKTSDISKNSFELMLNYANSNIVNMSSDSLMVYIDSIVRTSYLVDTTGTNGLDMLIKLSEKALTDKNYSKKAARWLFGFYQIDKNYPKAIEVSEKYLNDSTEIALLFNQSLLYLKIGNKLKADSCFRKVKLHCEKTLEKPEKLKQESYVGTIYTLSIITFIEEGKSKAIRLMKRTITKYPDDLFVKGLYEQVTGYEDTKDLLSHLIP